jgi:hypothetical protein
VKIKSKFGIVVFLDALGARTTDIAVSESYLAKTANLKAEIINSKDIIRVVEEMSGETRIPWRPARLKYRLFGDSILITYSVTSGRALMPSLLNVIFIINSFVCASIKLGILFRGALSIGKYLETIDVMLGPAITDAANWYDQPDMIGVMLTPAATNRVRAEYKINSESTQYFVESPDSNLLLYDVPISRRDGKSSTPVRTYTANWPKLHIVAASPTEYKDALLWFYNRIRSLPVPLGTESKYSNTEAYIKKSVECTEQRRAILLSAEKQIAGSEKETSENNKKRQATLKA